MKHWRSLSSTTALALVLGLAACGEAEQAGETSETETQTEQTESAPVSSETTPTPPETPPATSTDAQAPDPFAAARSLPAPKAKREPKEITQHGETRTDNYFWMKDDNWQQVLREPSVLRSDIRDHLLAENDYYADVMQGQEALRDTLVAEMRGRIKEDDSTVPAPDGPFEYYVRFREGGQYAVYARRPVGGGEEQILLDGDVMGEGKAFFDVGGVNWSPDHKLLAYGIDEVGSEYFTIRVKNLETGEVYPDAIESTSGSVVWANDSQTFYYVERDDNQRPRRVKRHTLGTDPANDPVIYEENDAGFFLSASKTSSGRFILINAGGHTTNEVYYLDADDPAASPTMISSRENGEEYGVVHNGDYFYIRTNADDAVDFKIMRAPISDPARENWEDWLPHESGTFIRGIAAYKDHLVRLERKDALPRIYISDYEGDGHAVDFEEEAFDLGLGTVYEYETSTIRFTYESPSTPRQTFDYGLDSRERTLLKTQEVPSGHNPDLYIVERLEAEAPDGAKVPITVLRLKTTPTDGSAPLMLYGYGSYGYTIDAGFSTNILSIVDRGAVYAIAHIRGGTARGYQWYLDGKLDKKMNTFTDFVAAAEDLVARGYTSRGRIVSYGGSAGGLLVGASVNLAPDLFGGVIGAVPFVDVLNTISDPSLPLTPPEWPEWGNPIEDKDAYGWIKAYSPYDNIQSAEYPPILATGGLADYRVTYWEPSKWVARLREEAKGGPFLLKMEMEAGHGGSAARFKRMEERAHLYAFALKVFGLTEAEPVSHKE